MRTTENGEKFIQYYMGYFYLKSTTRLIGTGWSLTDYQAKMADFVITKISIKRFYCNSVNNSQHAHNYCNLYFPASVCIHLLASSSRRITGVSRVPILILDIIASSTPLNPDKSAPCRTTFLNEATLISAFFNMAF